MALAPAGLPVTPSAVSPVGFGRLAARRVPRADGASDHGGREAWLRCCLGFHGKWCGTELIGVLACVSMSSLISEDISVAVVGAGPVGLLAALALARRGYRKARKLADGEIL